MMSVQSTSLSPATLDPAPIRRARAETDRARQGEAFTLPEPARDPQTRRDVDDRPSARAEEARKADDMRKPDDTRPSEGTGTSDDKRMAAETRRREEAASPGDAEQPATGSDAKPAGDDKASTRKAATTDGKPIVAQAPGPAPQPGASGGPQIEASATLMAAVAAADADAAVVTTLDGTVKAEDDIAAGEEPALDTVKPDPTAIVAAEPPPAPTASPQAVPLLDAAILLATVAAAPGSTETTRAGRGDEAPPTPAAAGPAAGQAQMTAPRGLDGAAAMSLAFAARQGDAEAAKPDATFGEVVAAAKAKDAPDVAKAVPMEGKPVEAPQTLPGPIDLSFLSQTRAARPETAIVVPASTEGAQATAAGAQPQSAGPATPIHVVPLEIGLQALAGSKRFDIRLDPAELGRVDVNLEISDKGEVTAKLVVDRVETLHMLQRDARTLERAFEQAGLKPSDAGVEITLRDPSDQSGFRQNRQDGDAPRRARPSADGDGGDDVAISAAQATPARRLLRLGGVDLSI